MKNLTVLKLGGNVLNDKKNCLNLIEAISELLEENHYFIVVHGGGSQADELLIKLHIPIKKLQGKRITDKKTLKIIKMVYGGTVNLNLTAWFVKLGISAIGLSGADANLVQVTKRPPQLITDQKTNKQEIVDFGYVGDIKEINTKLLYDLLALEYIPLIACLGIDEEGSIFNINADRLATHIALSMHAENLIFITDTEGVLESKNGISLTANLPIHQAKQMIASGQITDGMIAKIENTQKALEGGIKKVLITGGINNKADWMKMIEKKTFGTLITN